MGKTISQVVDDATGVCVSAMWLRGESLDDVLAASDVLIDFSLPEATVDIIAAALEHGTPLVCGVSGLNAAQMATLERAAIDIPIVFDRNMSQGVTVLSDLVRRAAKSLGPDFAADIHEVHHVHKIDSPSGTALKLGEAIDESRAPDAAAVRYEVERKGEVPGDHSVTFSSPTESLLLKHSVTTRQVFAEGALRAAKWVRGQQPGLYGMHDVLFSDS
jgi:4-hydroxy-tetrahydrodipicolinate reductase